MFENAILKSTELKADTKIAVGLDTEQTLNYQGLFVVAVGAIQELETKLASVLARLDALENT